MDSVVSLYLGEHWAVRMPGFRWPLVLYESIWISLVSFEWQHILKQSPEEHHLPMSMLLQDSFSSVYCYYWPRVDERERQRYVVQILCQCTTSKGRKTEKVLEQACVCVSVTLSCLCACVASRQLICKLGLSKSASLAFCWMQCLKLYSVLIMKLNLRLVKM